VEGVCEVGQSVHISSLDGHAIRPCNVSIDRLQSARPDVVRSSPTTSKDVSSSSAGKFGAVGTKAVLTVQGVCPNSPRPPPQYNTAGGGSGGAVGRNTERNVEHRRFHRKPRSEKWSQTKRRLSLANNAKNATASGTKRKEIVTVESKHAGNLPCPTDTISDPCSPSNDVNASWTPCVERPESTKIPNHSEDGVFCGTFLGT